MTVHREVPKRRHPGVPHTARPDGYYWLKDPDDTDGHTRDPEWQVVHVYGGNIYFAGSSEDCYRAEDYWIWGPRVEPPT